MRGAPWLASLVTIVVVLAAIPLVAHAADGPDARDASPVGSGRPRISESRGEALLHFSGACLDGDQCYGGATVDEGTFFIPAAAVDGLVTVSWRPVNDSLRTLRVRVSGVEMEGESPLRFVVPGLPAGEHRVTVAPAQRLIGKYEQRVEWVSILELAEPQARVVAHGSARFEPAASCALVVCQGVLRQTSDPLVVPWTARGTLVATWDRLDGEREVCIAGTQLCAAGETPLELTLDGLAAGSHTIAARGAGLTREVASGEIAWETVLTPL